MKNKTIYLLTCMIMFFAIAEAQWVPVQGKISTEWATKVNPANPLPEYPRPQLVRGVSSAFKAEPKAGWKSLNGLWQYAILPKNEGDAIPASFQGTILVPYAVESSLSGVGKRVGKDDVLWYNRTIEVPAAMRKGRLLLHFGGVDWAAQVYVNGKKAGSHEGGYDAFTLDITDALQKGSKQNIVVRVWDPTGDGPQPIGKQRKNPGGIFYTSVTGIWQTVWLESVPETHIVSTKQTPDIDKQQLTVSVDVSNRQPGDEVIITAFDNDKSVATQSSKKEGTLVLQFSNPKLWSPQSPFLYDLKVAVKRNGKIVDEVSSYFGMRKISMGKDKNGIQRMMLNNAFAFQYGPLDQGWWPDGLYTAPTDDALKFDVEQTKALGFNMIRKHVKVEPARWYYYCDKIGIVVWQDMPGGDLGGNGWYRNLRIKMPPGEKVDDAHELKELYPGLVLERKRSPESEAIYSKEWKAIMDELYNYPSIVVWTPFNESWGQFKTKEIVNWTMGYDSSRLINPASGGNFFIGTGQMLDLHYYPGPAMPDPEIYGNKQVLVLGEFGGMGMPVKGHTWINENSWGFSDYPHFTVPEKLLERYTSMINAIPAFIKNGLSAAVYTQTTDVEAEINGIFTYDRKVLKMPKEKLFQMHQQLYNRTLAP